MTGENGSSKSTFIKILCGLLKYSSGQVSFGNLELKDICLSELYEKVTYLSQDTPVFDRTIRENLVFNQDVPDEQILKALQKIQLSYLIERSAKGLDTEIGEKGTGLSGDEKQRLALDRLWFQDSDIVLEKKLSLPLLTD